MASNTTEPDSATVTVAPAKEVTVARVQGITEMYGSFRHLYPDPKRTKKFIDAASPEELDLLDETITAFPSTTLREQEVIRSIFSPLSTRNMTTRMIFELLAHRVAFLVEKTGGNSPDNIDYTLDEYIYGARHVRTPNEYATPLSYTDERLRLENIALIKFAFALDQRAPRNDLVPTIQKSVPRSVQGYARVYSNIELTTLLMDYPDRVDDIIDLSVGNETIDPHLLRAYMEHEGHASLTSGVL